MTDSQIPKRDLEAREYLAGTFQPSDRLALLLRNRLRGETVQRITTLERILEPPFQEWLHLKNDREGFDVYIGMNPLKAGARTRTKDDILSIRHLYADLDHNGPTSLASIKQSSLVPQPNYVLSTSPGKFQVVWKVKETNQDQADALLRAIARKFGGNPSAIDSTRVLRIPGFSNRKYEDSFVVRAEQHSGRLHHFLDFKLRVDRPDSSYQPLRRATTRATSAETSTQSVHDQSFANRTLAGADDPQEVHRRIAPAQSSDAAEISDTSKELP